MSAIVAATSICHERNPIARPGFQMRFCVAVLEYERPAQRPRISRNRQQFRRNFSCAANLTQVTATKRESRTRTIGRSMRNTPTLRNLVAARQPLITYQFFSGSATKGRHAVCIRDRKMPTQIQSGGERLFAIASQILSRGRSPFPHMRRRFH